MGVCVVLPEPRTQNPAAEPESEQRERDADGAAELGPSSYFK